MGNTSTNESPFQNIIHNKLALVLSCGLVLFFLFLLVECCMQCFKSINSDDEDDDDVVDDDPGIVMRDRAFVRSELLAIVIDSSDSGREVCSICLNEYETGDKIIRLEPCEHLFHGSCVRSWMKVALTCPTCRFPVRDPLLE